jgi:UDP-N-acetylmuramoyl-L-alanyl-D-glutamate--2,6-diaminopimelate ligase
MMKEIFKKLIPNFLLSLYHFILAFFGALIYRFPSRPSGRGSPEAARGLKVIGVTGTNGKTTTTEMISKILEETDYKVALLNSIRFKIGKDEELNRLRMTMPGRFFIQRFLRKAVNSNCQYAILEVTSEGIKQHRHRFINFQAAVFTNLAPEHIEAHGSFEKYKEAKGKLFRATKNIHIINVDDENSNYFLKFPAKKKITFGLEKGDINLKNTNLNLKIPGQFNLYNALAAISVAISQGIDKDFARKVLEEFKGVPGRMEEVISEPFKVIVDYAFTPNALEKVYSTLANLHEYPTNSTNIREISGQIRANSRLICVLGACGGGRDKWKRPVLGELAAKYCDEIIVTNEDPYDENPMEIIEQVAKGTENISINQPHQHKSAVHKILDRREAIKEAIKLAKKGDIVVITGKGCEPSIVEKGKKIPWDDRRVVREEFKNRQNLTDK